MTSKVAPYLAAATIALALPAAAFAQSGSSAVPTGPTSQSVPAPIAPSAPTMNSPTVNDSIAPGSSIGSGDLQKQSFEAQDLKGKKLYDSAGKKVGSIDAVVPQAGQPRDAIVAVGGIFGIGAKKVLIPAADIERSDDGRLTVAMSENQLQKLPEFERPHTSAPITGSMQ